MKNIYKFNRFRFFDSCCGWTFGIRFRPQFHQCFWVTFLPLPQCCKQNASVVKSKIPKQRWSLRLSHSSARQQVDFNINSRDQCFNLIAKMTCYQKLLYNLSYLQPSAFLWQFSFIYVVFYMHIAYTHNWKGLRLIHAYVGTKKSILSYRSICDGNVSISECFFYKEVVYKTISFSIKRWHFSFRNKMPNYHRTLHIWITDEK